MISEYKVSILLLILFLLSDVPAQSTIGEIVVPDSGYRRIEVNKHSFAAWLRSRKILPAGSPVLDYRERRYKADTDTTVARVMDIDIINRRLEQCMDILVRLYSEYSWQTDKTADLAYPLPGGYLLSWSDWRSGKRPVFKGVQVSMQYKNKPDSSYANFESYLRTIYAESHTQQFYHGYNSIKNEDLEIGDFIVSKGSKAHAIMIVDLVINDQGNMMMLIGHGDTPACQFYLLNNKKDQPWFPVNVDQEVLPLPIKRKMKWSGLRRFSLKKSLN